MLLNAVSWEVGELTFCQENPAARQARVKGESYQERNVSFVWNLTATTTTLMVIHIFTGCAGFVSLSFTGSETDLFFSPRLQAASNQSGTWTQENTVSGQCPSGSHNRRHYVLGLSIGLFHSCEQEGRALSFSSKPGKNSAIVLVRGEKRILLVEGQGHCDLTTLF